MSGTHAYFIQQLKAIYSKKYFYEKYKHTMLLLTRKNVINFVLNNPSVLYYTRNQAMRAWF